MITSSHRSIRYVLFLGLILFMVVGCQAITPGNGQMNVQTSYTSIPPSSTAAPTRTPNPSPTPVATVAPRPTPIQTPTQTQAPTNSPTALPAGAEVISPENAAQLEPIAVWGRGASRNIQAVANGHAWLVQTPGGLYIYQARNLNEYCLLEGAKRYLLHPDGTSLLVIMPRSGVIKIWNLLDCSQIATIEHSVNLTENSYSWMGEEYLGINTLAFTSDGKRLAVAYSDNQIVMWDAVTWKQLQLMTSNVATSPQHLVFTRDGRYLLASDWSVLGIWDLQENKLINRMPEPGLISDDPVSPDGKLLVTAYDSTVLIYTFPGGDLLYSWGSSGARSLSFTPDSKYILDRLYIRHLESGVRLRPDVEAAALEQYGLVPQATPVPTSVKPDFEALGHWSNLQGAQFTQEGDILIWGWESLIHREAAFETTRESGSDSTTVGNLFWRYLYSGTCNSIPLSESLSNKIVPGPAAESLAVCAGKQLIVVDLATANVSSFPGCRPLGALTYQNSQTIARANADLIDLVNLADGKTEHNLRGHMLRVTALAYSLDQTLLASSTEVLRGGAEVYLWKLDPLLQFWKKFKFNTYAGQVSNLAFSPDKTLLVVGGGNHVKIYRVADLWQLKVFTLNSMNEDLVFSPDGQLLAAGNSDGSIILWSMPDGKEVIRLTGHVGGVLDLSFDPDGKSLFTISDDGTVKLWGLR